MNKDAAIQLMNTYGSESVPFIFIIDFEMTKCHVIKWHEIAEHQIEVDLNNRTKDVTDKDIIFKKFPIPYSEYEKSFSIVKKNLEFGNSYLCNLTALTPIDTNLSLKEIYLKSEAPYKLLFKDKFVVFSPETFVQIKQGKIYSYPMKGTIDAQLPDAENTILSNKKEAAEHATITDLIRNDLSTIASHVTVEKYRYIDKIVTNQGELLQVSSKISGVLPENYQEQLGTILFSLLPAGSISGAPKQKTMDIIREAETYKRGYYTGIFGIFDGKELDTAVMIRFIEKIHDKLFFKSGGGITVNSNCLDEYNELIDKVYLPIIK